MAVSYDTVVSRKYRGTYYVYYILMANGKIYTGYTSNLKKRYIQHESGAVVTTSKYLPLRIIGYEAYVLKTDTQRREKYLKTTEGKRYFRNQFRDILSQTRQHSSVG